MRALRSLSALAALLLIVLPAAAQKNANPYRVTRNGPLERRARRLLGALQAGDAALARRLAGSDPVEMMVRENGPVVYAATARLDAGSLRPLLRWARRRGPSTIRSAEVMSGGHGSRYNIVAFRLRDGYFYVGSNEKDRIDKIFATKQAVEWD